jgi:DNA polymerase-1
VKVRAGKASAIMSKKLATIITNVPVQFHEEDFRLKEKNKAALTEIFNELEFKTLGKRILGDDFAITNTPSKNEDREAQQQTDLFGNTVNVKPKKQKASKKAGEDEIITTDEEEDNSDENDFGGMEAALVVNKNIDNTAHDYKSVIGEKAIDELIAVLLKQKEICIDTETTGVDANNVSLVGLSFSFKEHEGYYIPVEDDGDGKTGATFILKNLNHFLRM